jgi:hypothetical protein
MIEGSLVSVFERDRSHIHGQGRSDTKQGNESGFELPDLGCSVSVRLSLLLAHVFTLIGISVRSRSGKVINAGSPIHPNLVLGCLHDKRFSEGRSI